MGEARLVGATGRGGTAGSCFSTRGGVPSASVRFEWDEYNEEHITAHNADREGCESVWDDPHRVGIGFARRGGEVRHALLGRTGAGRLLFVVYTLRSGRVRVVTARDATRSERRTYRRNNQ